MKNTKTPDETKANWVVWVRYEMSIPNSVTLKDDSLKTLGGLLIPGKEFDSTRMAESLAYFIITD